MSIREILGYAPDIVFWASMAAAVLPAPKPGSFGSSLVAFINIAAANVGHAANATPAALKTERGNTSNSNVLSIGLLFTVLGLLALSPVPAMAEGITVRWAPPTLYLPDPQTGVSAPLPAADLGPFDIFLGDKKIGTAPPTALSWAYTIPTGTCIEVTDQFFVVATVTDGRRSPLSAPPALLKERRCTPKVNPAAPSNVTVSAGP